MDDSIGPIEGQAPGIGAADPDGRGAEGERLHDVEPVRTPESNSTGVFPAASTTPGSMSRQPMPPLAWRPPWVEQ